MAPLHGCCWHAPVKQRHTAKLNFERLRVEHGFAGGYTVVKNYVRLARARSREMFVPLAHPPGHAQADFGEAVGVIGGIRQKIHFFCMELPNSGINLHSIHPGQLPKGITPTSGRFLPRPSQQHVGASVVYFLTAVSTACVSGKIRVNVDPCPNALVTSIRPP